MISYHPETGSLRVGERNFSNIHLAVNAIQYLFGAGAEKSLDMFARFKMIFPLELPFTLSRKEMDEEIRTSEILLSNFISSHSEKNNELQLFKKVREVNKNCETEFEGLLIRPHLISTWLSGTKEIIFEKKPKTDILFQVLMESELEKKYCENSVDILSFLEYHLEEYFQNNSLNEIKNLMFDVKNLLLNDRILLAAPYKQVAMEISNIINEENIPEPQHEEKFKSRIKSTTEKCLKVIRDGLIINTEEQEVTF